MLDVVYRSTSPLSSLRPLTNPDNTKLEDWSGRINKRIHKEDSNGVIKLSAKRTTSQERKEGDIATTLYYPVFPETLVGKCSQDPLVKAKLKD